MSNYYVDVKLAIDLSTIVAYFFRDGDLYDEIEIHLSNGRKYIIQDIGDEKNAFRALMNWHDRLWKEKDNNGISHSS